MKESQAQRISILLLALLLASGLARAQAVLRKDLKRDFGAVGDGRTNDQAAFEKAADFFNKRAPTPPGATQRAVLYIPKGVYLVGRPGPDGSVPNVLHLKGCRNLTILGDDSATTEIRYARGLRYGAFDPATGLPYESPKSFFTDWSWGVRLGTCLELQQCDNIEVSNLSLNGSSPALVVGGHWGDTGIQLSADGIFVGNSRRVTLRRLALHHFGRDGVQVLNRLAKRVDDPQREDVVLENSTCTYNGRQGLSLTGVNGFRAVNCSFSHTGRVVVPALGRPLYSNPGAGVDLEPEGGFVANVRFDNCRFVDNAGQGVVSDRYGDGPPTTKNIVFRNCLLWGVTNWSAWVRQTDFLFENCRLYGAFTTGCALARYATRFVGCTFEDRPYHGQPAYGPALLYSNQEARAMSFTNCRFVGTRGYLLLATPAAPDTASRFRLRGCTFTYRYAELPLGTGDQLRGAVFSGDNTFQGEPTGLAPPRLDLELGGPGPDGPTVVRAPGRLRLAAPAVVYTLRAGLDIGRAADGAAGAASVEVGAGSALVLSAQAAQVPELYVGPRARLVVRRGGALVLQAHTRLALAGQLLVEDGAYFAQDPQAEVSTREGGRLSVGAGFIKARPPLLAEAAR